MPHSWMIRREVDLERDFIGVERLAALATTSAKAAHELRIAVKSGGVSICLDGTSVMLNLILQDGISMTAYGSIEEGVCIATLPDLCYRRGETRGVLLIQFGTQGTIPVYAFILRCFEDLTDVFADPNHVIPSINEILEQLDAAKAAAKAAQDGAAAANSAADVAMTAAKSAKFVVLGHFEALGALMSAHPVGNPGDAYAVGEAQPYMVYIWDVDTACWMNIGQLQGPKGDTGEQGPQGEKGEKGDTGATPQISVQVQTGAAGSEASVSVSGTEENPVIHLTIPRGDVGDIGNLTINGKAPDSSGAVTLTVSDVGALEIGGTAADSSKLGGKTLAQIMLEIYPVGAVYISANSTSPASLFGGTWESIGGRFLLGADSTYTAGSAGGEATHTLTNNELPIITGSIAMRASETQYNTIISASGVFNTELESNVSSTLALNGSGNFSRLNMSFGGNEAHNNMPPYLAVYMWKRVS